VSNDNIFNVNNPFKTSSYTLSQICLSVYYYVFCCLG